jgi:hypothetical protein
MHLVYQLHTPFVAAVLVFAAMLIVAHAGERR